MQHPTPYPQSQQDLVNIFLAIGRIVSDNQYMTLAAPPSKVAAVPINARVNHNALPSTAPPASLDDIILQNILKTLNNAPGLRIPQVPQTKSHEYQNDQSTTLS